MKKKYIILLFSILLLSGLLTACAGGTASPTSWPGVTVDMDRGTVYVANNQHIYAVNLENGTEKWRFPQEADRKISFFAAPALTEDGQLVVGGYDHLFYSLDPANGSVKWTFDGADNIYVAGPLAAGEQIFAPNSNNQLYALALAGNLVWKFETGHSLWGTPATNGDNLYLASMDHYVYAIDKASGAQVWKTEDLGGAVAGSPTLGPDGVLYVGTFANDLIALDTTDGSEIWRVAASNWVWSGPALDGEFLYFGDLSGTMYSLNAVDGSIRWQVQPDTSDKKAISNSPLVVNDTVYFVTDGGALWALDTQTGTGWSKTVEGRLYTAPEVAGDTILIAAVDTDAILYAFNLDGSQKWEPFVPEKK